MEEILKQILEGQQQILQEIATVKAELSEAKDELKNNIYGVETQLIETNSIARNIEHASASTAAQLDGINIRLAKLEGTAATKEDINRLMTQHKLLNDRLFEQETEISILKAVK